MKIAGTYWSGSGNTEIMANAMVQGIQSTYNEVTLFEASSFEVSMINEYDRFVFGCSTIGAEQYEENVFEPMFSSVEIALSGKEVLLQEGIEQSAEVGMQLGEL